MGGEARRCALTLTTPDEGGCPETPGPTPPKGEDAFASTPPEASGPCANADETGNDAGTPDIVSFPRVGLCSSTVRCPKAPASFPGAFTGNGGTGIAFPGAARPAWPRVAPLSEPTVTSPIPEGREEEEEEEEAEEGAEVEVDGTEEREEKARERNGVAAVPKALLLPGTVPVTPMVEKSGRGFPTAPPAEVEDMTPEDELDEDGLPFDA